MPLRCFCHIVEIDWFFVALSNSVIWLSLKDKFSTNLAVRSTGDKDGFLVIRLAISKIDPRISCGLGGVTDLLRTAFGNLSLILAENCSFCVTVTFPSNSSLGSNSPF